MAQTIVCSVINCEKPARRVGYCHAHYRRSRLGQPLDVPVRSWGSAGKVCSVSGCEREPKAQSLCPAHYRRSRLGIPLTAPIRHRGRRGDTCSIDACERLHVAGGLCAMHWQRQQRTGDVGGPGPLLAAAGTGYVNPDGYRVFWVDGRNVFEHRMVMERIIGRPLEAFETVHHKNGIRSDNEPENLEIWTVPQPYGQRPEDLVAWIVEHYRDLVIEHLSKP